MSEQLLVNKTIQIVSSIPRDSSPERIEDVWYHSQKHLGAEKSLVFYVLVRLEILKWNSLHKEDYLRFHNVETWKKNNYVQDRVLCHGPHRWPAISTRPACG